MVSVCQISYVLADPRAMYVISLVCVDAECGASFDVHAVSRSHGVTVCRFCGGDLVEGATTSVVGDEGLDIDEYTQIIVRSRPRGASVVSRLSALADDELPPRVTEAFRVGTPTWLTSGSDRAVLIGTAELARLVADPALRIEVLRGYRPDRWTFALQGLAISEFGFSYQEGFGRLILAVRRAIRCVLDDAMAPYSMRNQALQLWLAEAEGRLDEVLEAAVQVDEQREPSE